MCLCFKKRKERINGHVVLHNYLYVLDKKNGKPKTHSRQHHQLHTYTLYRCRTAAPLHAVQVHLVLAALTACCRAATAGPPYTARIGRVRGRSSSTCATSAATCVCTHTVCKLIRTKHRHRTGYQQHSARSYTQDMTMPSTCSHRLVALQHHHRLNAMAAVVMDYKPMSMCTLINGKQWRSSRAATIRARRRTAPSKLLLHAVASCPARCFPASHQCRVLARDPPSSS